jgi:hypothetical protein
MASKKLLLTLACITALAMVTVGCGGDDDDSNPVVPVVDTAPPALPSGLQLALDSDGAILTWDENTTDVDFAGFLVSRTIDGSGTIALVEVPQAQAGYHDISSLPVGAALTYLVYSVDTSGNASAAAVASCVVEYDAPTPDERQGNERPQIQ